MKIFSKAFIVAFSLLSIITIKGDALEKAPPNVELEGNANGIVYIPGDEPFLLGEEMVPGDQKQIPVKLWAAGCPSLPSF